jgi:hypothetical protein
VPFGFILLVVALLLVPAMSPPTLGISHAIAQEADEPMAEFDDSAPPSALDNKSLRRQIRALRQAIRFGDLTRYERRQVKAQIRAYRSELRARKQDGDLARPTAPVAQRPAKARDNRKQTKDQSTRAPAAAKQKALQPSKGAVPLPPAKPPAPEHQTAPQMAKQATPEEQTASPLPVPGQQAVQQPTKAPTVEQETAPPTTKAPEQQQAARQSAKTAEEPPPKSATRESEADCKNVWNEANENNDDVLADDEAAPFAEALRASGAATGAGESETTINRTQFMDACMKGAFADLM